MLGCQLMRQTPFKAQSHGCFYNRLTFHKGLVVVVYGAVPCYAGVFINLSTLFISLRLAHEQKHICILSNSSTPQTTSSTSYINTSQKLNIIMFCLATLLLDHNSFKQLTVNISLFYASSTSCLSNMKINDQTLKNCID